MQTPRPLFTLHTLFRCWFALNCAINEMNWRGKNQINRNKMITNASYIIIDPVAKRKMERKGGKKRTHWSHNNSTDFHNLQSSHVLFRCDYHFFLDHFFFFLFFSYFSFSRWLFMELIFMHWTVSLFTIYWMRWELNEIIQIECEPLVRFMFRSNTLTNKARRNKTKQNMAIWMVVKPIS